MFNKLHIEEKVANIIVDTKIVHLSAKFSDDLAQLVLVKWFPPQGRTQYFY